MAAPSIPIVPQLVEDKATTIPLDEVLKPMGAYAQLLSDHLCKQVGDDDRAMCLKAATDWIAVWARTVGYVSFMGLHEDVKNELVRIYQGEWKSQHRLMTELIKLGALCNSWCPEYDKCSTKEMRMKIIKDVFALGMESDDGGAAFTDRLSAGFYTDEKSKNRQSDSAGAQ